MSNANIKAIISHFGGTPSAGPNLTVEDRSQYYALAQLKYGATQVQALYGVAYPSILPAALADAIANGPGGEPAPVAVSIAITPADFALAVGESVPYTAIVTYDDESTAPAPAETHVITDTGVATTDGTNVVGVAEGTTVLTVTVGGVSATADILVSAAG